MLPVFSGRPDERPLATAMRKGAKRVRVHLEGQVNGIHEVTGSIPVSSTNSNNKLAMTQGGPDASEPPLCHVCVTSREASRNSVGQRGPRTSSIEIVPLALWRRASA